MPSFEQLNSLLNSGMRPTLTSASHLLFVADVCVSLAFTSLASAMSHGQATRRKGPSEKWSQEEVCNQLLDLPMMLIQMIGRHCA